MVAGVAWLWPATAGAQSFDCATARSPDEMAICREPGLARLDQELATLQRHELRKLSEADREVYEQHGALFLNARRRCGDRHRCIEQSYRNRIKEFQEFLTASQPDAAKSGGLSEQSTERQASRSKRDADATAAVAAQPEARPAPVAPPADRGRSSDVTVGVEPGAPAPPKASAESTPKRQRKRDRAATAVAAAQSEARPKPAPSTEGSGGSTPTIRWVNPPPAR